MNNTSPQTRKPGWLKTRPGGSGQYAATAAILSARGLHTICQSGRCPNKGACWERGTATFLIGGNICTRSCKFCNTPTGKPLPLAADEPGKIAEAIRLMGLTHAVITSVDRDDLPDLGARHWAETIVHIKAMNPATTVEALIPDFQGKTKHLDTLIQASPDIIAHNMETVKRLTPLVRSRAKYDTSLAVLRHIARSGIPAKSGLMLGLGETVEETAQTIQDIYNTGCRLLSIGQYLQPSARNLPVSAYISPQQFDDYKTLALQTGYKHVESAPLVRSSYRAEKYKT
ncbi:MAG: lipoyl synthase [Dysgonamonadaceae bacterium]|jgi:lipoic acid synthetase|nr:lipoyl synthase [Dysgonamonadaceae bacterium]